MSLLVCIIIGSILGGLLVRIADKVEELSNK